MKRLKSIINLLMIFMVLVIPITFPVYGAPIFTESKNTVQGQDSPIDSIINQVRKYRKAGRFEEALKQLNIALEKFPQKEYREKLQIELASLHYWWAESFRKRYDYANAIKHFKMAYAIDKIYRLKNAAIDLNYIGFLYSTLGQKQKALGFYQKALTIIQAVGHRNGVAITLNNIGVVYNDLGQKQKALEFYQKALPISQAVGDRTKEAAALINIGRVYSDLGQRQKALEFYQKALPISQAVGDRAKEAATLNNIGRVYSGLGQKQKALEFYQKALPIFQAVGNRVGEATTLNNTGSVYSTFGQKQKALEYYEKALTIQNAVGDRIGEANTLNNIGLVYDALGQKQKILQYYQKALTIQKEVGERVGESATLNNIGGVYYDLGQKQKALEYYEKALPIQRAVGGLESKTITLRNLMACWESLKNKQFSIFYGKQSVNVIQDLRANNSKFNRAIKKSHFEKSKNIYRRLARLLISEGRIPEVQHVLDMLKEKEYFEFTRKDQSTPTYSQLDFTGFENQWLEKYKKVTKDYSAISGDYYLLKKKKMKSDAENKRMKELEAALERYQKDYDRYLTKLKKAFDKYNKTVKKEMIKTPNSQKLLRERQAVLRKLDEIEGGKNVFLHFQVQEERIAVIFTTPDSQFVRFSNVSKKKLNRLILEYREAIDRRKKAPQKGVNIDSLNKTIYGKLYDHIFKPIDIELKKYGATNLMIYLDGLLRYIALPVLWDGENYLVQRYRMALFTTVSFDRIKRKPGKKKKILGLGASRGGDGFDPLPNVKDEIQGIVNDKEKGFNGIIPGKAFLDNDFTKETFVNQLKTAAYPLVHISSHFQFNKGDETNSHLLMGDGSLMNLQEIREQKGLFNRVELLMLSACETGRGDADGREIDGFGELAQQSGAQSVVASLWKVTDESTKDLMVNFYRILKEGKVTSKIQALRQAQLELAGLEDLRAKNNSMVKKKKTKYSHPYYWGPFIMIGNWR
jgi:CHAT domain-containing protein/tetratricopeptide (TPR) repeat protein